MRSSILFSLVVALLAPVAFTVCIPPNLNPLSTSLTRYFSILQPANGASEPDPRP